VGAYEQAGQTFAQTTGVFRNLITASTSPEQAQRLALQLADLRAADPDTTFQRALLGFGSVIITSILLGSTVDRLEALSWTDGLTGVANRRHFDAMLDQEWSRALRTRAPLSIIMVDVDFFKNYNDTFGHARGDECLQAVARALAEGAKRAGDVIARYGGEEFVLLLPSAHGEGLKTHADALRGRIEALAIAHPKPDGCSCVTASLGVASRVADRETRASDLLALADAALYQAKASGRNRVVYDVEAAPVDAPVEALVVGP
jgi:diguanylate cyclase (GGDEF)-like protein